MATGTRSWISIIKPGGNNRRLTVALTIFGCFLKESAIKEGLTRHKDWGNDNPNS